jgi:hypothetical protein
MFPDKGETLLLRDGADLTINSVVITLRVMTTHHAERDDDTGARRRKRRQGAVPSNLRVADATCLQLLSVDSTKLHRRTPG